MIRRDRFVATNLRRAGRRSGAYIGAALLLLIMPAWPAFGQATVQRVEVRLTIDDVEPHSLIRERLQATAESVVDRLLLGRPVDQVLALQPRLGETIGAVLDRVATGYAVTGASAQLGVVSTLALRMRPVGPVIREVSVRPQWVGVHLSVQPLLEGLLQPGAVGEIRALFVGLPVAALEWAEPVAGARARQIVEGALPGFTGAVRVRAGAAALIEVTVAARDTRVIRNIGVRFRSSSMPTILLDQNGPQVASMAEPLRGLPVAFAEAHRQVLARLINDELNAYAPVREYQVVASVGLDVAETTYVTVVADSLLFRGRVEAQLNIGSAAPGPAVVAHLGRLVAPATELFVEVRVVPNTLSMEWAVGGQYEVSPGTLVGLNYAVLARDTTAWTAIRLGPDVSVRGAWNLTQQSFEGALTYRLNEFLAGELVATSRGEFWLRIVSNL